jgi:hypothetical protein
MINVFTPAMQALTGATIPNDTTAGPNQGQPCWSIVQDGAPNVIDDAFCNGQFGALFTSSVKNGFAGAMGIYLALKNHTLGSTSMLSLNDLFTLYGSSSFIGMKMTDVTPFAFGQQYNQTGGGTNYLNPVLSVTNGAFTLDPTFMSWSQSAISNSAAVAIFNAATFDYADSFKMFETIPTAANIKSSIFGASYHGDWNPTGNSTYWAAGGKNVPSANPQGVTTDPIFCKMTLNGQPVEQDMGNNPNLVVACADAASLTGVSVDANGKITVPDGFAYPYALTQWGYQGDSRGSVYALVDRTTGFWIQPNGMATSSSFTR